MYNEIIALLSGLSASFSIIVYFELKKRTLEYNFSERMVKNAEKDVKAFVKEREHFLQAGDKIEYRIEVGTYVFSEKILQMEKTIPHLNKLFMKKGWKIDTVNSKENPVYVKTLEFIEPGKWKIVK